MKLDRAIEIVESLGVIEVKYNNEEVWIEEIDENSKVATVKSLNTGDVLEAPVSLLEE